MKLSINITFLVILFGISINQIFHIIDKKDHSENRKLAEKPIMDINRLDYYPKEYNNYLNDNFAGRRYFVEYYAWLNKYIFQKKTINKKYILGKDNFIFEMKKNLPLYNGKRSITDEQLERIGTEFRKRQAYLNKMGIKLYIQIIPSKFKVYSNKLPLLLKKGNNNMGDQFIKYFKKNTTIPIIDGEYVLNKKRDSENVYLKYDTHWNTLGAFYIHAALIETIKKDLENIPALDTANFHIKPYNKEGGNMKWVAQNKNDFDFGYRIKPKNKTFNKTNGYKHLMVDFRYGQDSYCIRFKSSHIEYPKALLIRDSFGSFTTSFLPEVFSEILYIWDDWKYKFNKDIIDIEKPDIVIYSLYEGYIDRILMAPSFVKADIKNKDIQ